MLLIAQHILDTVLARHGFRPGARRGTEPIEALVRNNPLALIAQWLESVWSLDLTTDTAPSTRVVFIKSRSVIRKRNKDDIPAAVPREKDTRPSRLIGQ